MGGDLYQLAGLNPAKPFEEVGLELAYRHLACDCFWPGCHCNCNWDCDYTTQIDVGWAALGTVSLMSPLLAAQRGLS